MRRFGTCLALVVMLGGGGALHAGMPVPSSPPELGPSFMRLERCSPKSEPGAPPVVPVLRTVPVQEATFRAAPDFRTLEQTDFEVLFEETLDLQQEFFEVDPTDGDAGEFDLDFDDETPSFQGE